MSPIDPTILSTGGLELTRQTSTTTLITLSRPKALNALLPSTFHALHHVLDTLQPPHYLIISNGGRAFCAGGDVRALRTKVLTAGELNSKQRHDAAHDTLKTEYDLLLRLVNLRGSGIVTVSIADGLAFGAGAGLFQACSVRLVTEKTSLAMPECRIGLVPDCGATHFLTQLPGHLGMCAAMTGWKFSGFDLVKFGLAEGIVKTGWRGEGLEQVAVGEEHVIGMSERAEGSEICDEKSEMRQGVERVFGGTFDQVAGALEKEKGEWVKTALEGLNMGGPKALKECWDVMKRGYAGKGWKDALERELEVDSRLCAGWEFEEGVRAVLVDKDMSPKWEEPQEGPTATL